MREVEYFARKKGIWRDGRWTPPLVIEMWSAIWVDIDPYLRTQTRGKDGIISEEKSRQGQIAWRTCYNKLIRSGKNWLPSRNNVRDVDSW